MRVLLDSTSCETSLMILALSLGESVVNHFARRCCVQCGISRESEAGWETRCAPLSPDAIGGSDS